MFQEPIRILLVEDNPGDVALLEHALRQAPGLGFKRSHAETLDETDDLTAAGAGLVAAPAAAHNREAWRPWKTRSGA